MSANSAIALSSSELRIGPGEQATITVTLTSRFPFAEDYLLSASGVDPSWVTFRPPLVRLPPGVPTTVALLVRPPAGVQPINVSITIRMVSQRSGAVVAETALALIMDPTGTVRTSPGSPAAMSRSQGAVATPRWIIGLAVVGVVALTAVVGTIFFILWPHSTTSASPLSTVRYCSTPSGKYVSLSNFQDDPTTSILLSNEDRTDTRVLRTEPASTMPGLFDALLALTPDATKLAYVTAHSEMLDDAHIWYIDVAHPAQQHKLADVKLGLWVVQPVWSPDNQRLAYARLNEDLALKNETQLELWVATVGGQNSKVATIPQSRLKLDAFYGDKRASLCWAADNKTLLIQNVKGSSLATASPSPGVAGSPAATVAAGPTSTGISQPTAGPGAPATALPQPGAAVSPTASAEQTDQIQIDVQTGQAINLKQPPDVVPPPPGIDRIPPRAGPVPTGSGSPCGVPVMSQNDPAWRFTIMQTGGDTIGNYGCALTSTTMLLNYYGAVMSPDQLSACLGSNADLLQWAQVNHCTNGIVRFQDDLDFTWEAIDAQLGAGTPVIVGFRGGPAGMHFVVVTAGAGGDGANYAVTDPWDASTDKTLRYFMVRGYVPTWIVVYSGPGRNCTTRLIPGIGPPSHPPAAATAARPLGTPLPEGTATPRPAGTIPPAAGSFPQTWRTPYQALPPALSPTPAPRAPTATARPPAR